MTTNQPLILDTHVWFWLAVGDDKLAKSKNFKKFIPKLDQYSLCISSITLWEIAMLNSKGRIVLSTGCHVWLRETIEKTMVRIIDLTPEIAAGSSDLPGTFHGDPADKIIVSTTRALEGTLLTCDAKILKYGEKGHVNSYKV